ncbi:molybdenum cofactor cytidylyltransferase [Paracoccus isoporae]|uniref:Molybdenum cofactor cytidylyltransferase n=1 Tax=Paracoccus isoporae TaxID=591205 RepID=A0A1G7E9P6_9RHOB|nr:NTP transferase domain-containing protein [Paracoccus isoporae]SDE60280.1 molybdenum cofactor cytidylyltransferase [Paracoccus isoporae]
MRLGGLLLAAGASRRFGPEDKLLADLDGFPLVRHAALALRRAGPDLLVATVSSAQVGALLRETGFRIVTIPAGQPQSVSLSAGLTEMQRLQAQRCVLALGDMPYLADEDFSALLSAPADLPACMWSEGAPSPPAVVPRGWFGRLIGLRGDRGAREILQELPASQRVPAPRERLRDIDLLSDLPGR